MSHTDFARRCACLMLLIGALLAAHSGMAAKVDPKADVHPTAVLMGNVTVGPYTKIGPKAVIQGNVTIGHHVNILGNAVVSGEKVTIGNYVRIDYGARVVDGRPGDQTYVRDNCWIGMNATVRGSRLEEGASVGNGAVADFNTHLEPGAVLAHGAVSRHDTTIPAGALAEGLPARITKKSATDLDRQRIFGLIPSRWIHYENDRIAAAIDKNPPKRMETYPGIDGKQFWSGDHKIDPTAKIHPTAILMKNIVIGAYTRVGPGVIIQEGTRIGSHCDIRANANIRAPATIGNYVFIGERVHVGDSRTGGMDNPLFIKDYSYVSPGSVVHTPKMDAEVYYGANVTSDYGALIGEGAILTSGAAVRHDEVVHDHIVFEGNPGLSHPQPGISDAEMMDLLGFRPKKWLAEVMGPALEKSETYEPPLKKWEHVNKGVVKGKPHPSAILVGNVNVEEGAGVGVGSYLEGNITIKKRASVVIDVMIVSNDAIIGEHTHIYDKAMIVDGRPAKTGSTTNATADAVRIGIFSWINHLAALQGTSMGDFSLANIGVSAAYGTKIEREALLMNSSATYADQKLPARSISYGQPAKVRISDSTMWEREFFFYGKSYPTWERQAKPDELKAYKVPD